MHETARQGFLAEVQTEPGRKQLKERDEKDRSWIVLVVLVLVIAFLQTGFEDEDENEDEIRRNAACRYKNAKPKRHCAYLLNRKFVRS